MTGAWYTNCYKLIFFNIWSLLFLSRSSKQHFCIESKPECLRARFWAPRFTIFSFTALRTSTNIDTNANDTSIINQNENLDTYSYYSITGRLIFPIGTS